MEQLLEPLWCVDLPGGRFKGFLDWSFIIPGFFKETYSLGAEDHIGKSQLPTMSQSSQS